MGYMFFNSDCMYFLHKEKKIKEPGLFPFDMPVAQDSH